MTKQLRLDTTDFKFQDNNTDIYFKIFNNGLEVSDTEILTTIKVKNDDVGYLKSIKGTWSNGQILVSSGDFSDLPVGMYKLEVWTEDKNGTGIYPDYGFVRLDINKNALNIDGDVISSITLADFQQQFNDLSAEILNNLPEGKKGDPGKDAIINVITQADYNSLTDKSGVYFIRG